MARVGLLGGTFDPVHDGHVQLALAAKEEFLLDQVLLVPAAVPPHKVCETIASFSHRQEMLSLALAQIPNLEPSFIEGKLPTPSYTIDTVRLLQASDRISTEYYFIIGVDAFIDLLSWKSYRELLQRVNVILARRRGFLGEEQLHHLAATLGYTYNETCWSDADGLRYIFFLQHEPPQISSSSIRMALESGRGEKIDGLNPAVLEYIQRNHLYAK